MTGYSGPDNRSFYLQSFDGKKFPFDRVTEGRSGFIDRHLLSIHGGIQPDVLNQSILKGVDDGLAARALLFWPRRILPKKIVRGKRALTADLEAALRKLERISFSDIYQPYLLALSDAALERLNDWRINTQDPRLGETGKQASAIAKMENQLVRITGVLTLLDFAFGGNDAHSREISTDVMERAIQLVESYFIPQIDRVYNDIDLSEAELFARNIVRKIRKLGRKSSNVAKC